MRLKRDQIMSQEGNSDNYDVNRSLTQWYTFKYILSSIYVWSKTYIYTSSSNNWNTYQIILNIFKFTLWIIEKNKISHFSDELHQIWWKSSKKP